MIRWRDIVGRPEECWAVVTSTSPLKVRRIIDPVGVETYASGDLVGALAIGEKVWTIRTGRQCVIVGRQRTTAKLPSSVITRPANASVTATTFTNFGSSVALVLPAPAMCLVAMHGWLSVPLNAGNDLRVQAAWSGAITGDSQSLLNWGGVMFQQDNTVTHYGQHSVTLTLVVPAGTTNFQIQAYRDVAGTTAPSLNYASLRVTPLNWATEWVAGTD